MKNNNQFLPTLNVWNPVISEQIYSGKLKLQRGQWIKCGKDARPSRFVKVSKGGSIYAVHPKGERVSAERFRAACKCW